MTEAAEPSLRARLHAETARLPWQDLQTFFARGVVIKVHPELDLVEVAARMAEDDKAGLQAWLDAGRIGPVTTEQARDWYEREAPLWTVVVAPWVVVQEKD